MTRLLPLLLLAAACGDSKPAAPKAHPALFDAYLAREQAPAKFKVWFETTRGEFVAEFVRDWAPLGVDRVYNLVKIGYFTDVAFFRVMPGFIVQFGVHGNPGVNGAWRDARIPDDPVKHSNEPGMITFAKMRTPDSRTTQLFINYGNNANLDRDGFAPIGRVLLGMDVVRSIFAGYMQKPNQQLIQYQGNEYLKRNFPKLDYIKKAVLKD